VKGVNEFSMNRILFSLVGLAALILFVACSSTDGTRQTNESSPSSGVGSSSPSKNSIAVGQNARLDNSQVDSQEVTVGITEQALDDYMKAVAAKDVIGATELAMTHKTFSIRNNTKVLVLEIKGDKTKIRILSVKDFAKTGWVMTPCVKPDDTSSAANQPSLDKQLLDVAFTQVFSDDPVEVEATDKATEAKALINAGANVNAKDERGYTPLIWAAAQGHIKVMKVLLDNGADINAQNELGETALIMAAHFGDTKAAQLLIARGADKNIKDTEGYTALATAKDWGHTNVARILKKAGAKE
jgi:hypothetical protein